MAEKNDRYALPVHYRRNSARSSQRQVPLMRHCSVQVRGLLTRDELDRYNALMEVGSFLGVPESLRSCLSGAKGSRSAYPAGD